MQGQHCHLDGETEASCSRGHRPESCRWSRVVLGPCQAGRVVLSPGAAADSGWEPGRSRLLFLLPQPSGTNACKTPDAARPRPAFSSGRPQLRPWTAPLSLGLRHRVGASLGTCLLQLGWSCLPHSFFSKLEPQFP